VISAAAGGVGHIECQLAHDAGATVIALGSPRNHDYLRGLGASPVEYGDGLVDRVRALAPGGIDVILDFGGDDLVATSRALLADGGTVASIVDAAARDELGGHYVWVRPSTEDLDALTALIDAGTVKVEVAEVFELTDAAAAHEASATGHTRGKIVVRVA
jgi:NADPH2:quinone reductase